MKFIIISDKIKSTESKIMSIIFYLACFWLFLQSFCKLLANQINFLQNDLEQTKNLFAQYSMYCTSFREKATWKPYFALISQTLFNLRELKGKLS